MIEVFDFDPEAAPRETEAEEPAPKSHRIQEHWTAEDWHAEAQRLLHEDDLSGAVDAIRMGQKYLLDSTLDDGGVCYSLHLGKRPPGRPALTAPATLEAR